MGRFRIKIAPWWASDDFYELKDHILDVENIVSK